MEDVVALNDRLDNYSQNVCDPAAQRQSGDVVNHRAPKALGQNRNSNAFQNGRGGTESRCADQALRRLVYRSLPGDAGWTGGIVEIGRHLVEVKERVGHGNYTAFVTDRLGWSKRSGDNFVSVFEMFVSANFALEHVETLTIDASSLYLIAAPSTPARTTAQDGHCASRCRRCKVRVSERCF